MEPGREVVKFRTQMWEGMGPKHSTFSLTPLEILCHLIMIWLVHTRQSQCHLELRLVNSPTEKFLNSINDLNEHNIWTVVLRRLLRVPWTARRSNQVHPKGNQSWMFTGRTDAEAETPVLWPPDAKNWLIGKDPDARKDWRREEKGPTEDEMVGWHYRRDGHEFE